MNKKWVIFCPNIGEHLKKDLTDFEKEAAGVELVYLQKNSELY